MKLLKLPRLTRSPTLFLFRLLALSFIGFSQSAPDPPAILGPFPEPDLGSDWVPSLDPDPEPPSNESNTSMNVEVLEVRTGDPVQYGSSNKTLNESVFRVKSTLEAGASSYSIYWKKPTSTDWMFLQSYDQDGEYTLQLVDSEMPVVGERYYFVAVADFGSDNYGYSRITGFVRSSRGFMEGTTWSGTGTPQLPNGDTGTEFDEINSLRSAMSEAISNLTQSPWSELFPFEAGFFPSPSPPELPSDYEYALWYGEELLTWEEGNEPNLMNPDWQTEWQHYADDPRAISDLGWASRDKSPVPIPESIDGTDLNPPKLQFASFRGEDEFGDTHTWDGVGNVPEGIDPDTIEQTSPAQFGGVPRYFFTWSLGTQAPSFIPSNAERGEVAHSPTIESTVDAKGFSAQYEQVTDPPLWTPFYLLKEHSHGSYAGPGTEDGPSTTETFEQLTSMISRTPASEDVPDSDFELPLKIADLQILGRCCLTVYDVFGEVGISELRDGPGLLDTDPNGPLSGTLNPKGAIVYNDENSVVTAVFHGAFWTEPQFEDLVDSARIEWDDTLLDAFDSSGSPVSSPVTSDPLPSTLHFKSASDELGEVVLTFSLNVHDNTLEHKGYINIADATPSPPARPKPVTIPFDDMTGPRYRKISLIGRPMPDEKPQATAETDEAKEQTYIDAFTLGLTHSTTDIYQPIPGSDLALTVRRNAVPEIWNRSSGLRPHERPDLPFGSGWRSNLGAHVKFVNAPGDPYYAYVTDADGAVHQFAYAGPQHGFLPIPSGRHEAKEMLYTFTMESGNLPTVQAIEQAERDDVPFDAPSFTLEMKYGKKLEFHGIPLTLIHSADRLNGSREAVCYSFARLHSETDRMGYQIIRNYEFPNSLIPSKLQAHSASGPLPGQQIYISQTAGKVTHVWDPLGNPTSYVGGHTLQSVLRADGSSVNYSYDLAQEEETIPPPPASERPPNPTFHLNLKTITNGKGDQFEFEYELNHDKQVFVSREDLTDFFPQVGQPRRVVTVTLPSIIDQTGSNTGERPTVSFNANHLFQFRHYFDTGQNVFGATAHTTVTDASGQITLYEFDDIELEILHDFETINGTKHIANNPRLLLYKKMTITHPIAPGHAAGLPEVFEFDPSRSMALVRQSDYFGNVTFFEYGDAFTSSSPLWLLAGFEPQFYDDPTLERKIANGLHFVTSYRYKQTSRIMDLIIDPESRETAYNVDNLGRRTNETILNKNGTIAKTTDFVYGNTSFPGVVTATTMRNLGGGGGFNIISTSALDPLGRVQYSYSYPGNGNPPLFTETVYDLGNNKRAVYDPNRHITVFDYDARNRIRKITHEDNSFRRMTYDGVGNVRTVENENGFITENLYNQRNQPYRTVVEIGNGPPLETVTTYNVLGLPTHVSDPRGIVTKTEYDEMMRPDVITRAFGTAESVTSTMTYGENSGSSAFNTSGFKPTILIEPNSPGRPGRITYTTYDDLYRPTEVRVHYGEGQAVTTTVFDNVGNPKMVADPLGKTTITEYDALNRPTLVTFHDQSFVRTDYTTTGLTWKVTEGDNGTIRTTETLYDGMGRPCKVIQPATDAGNPETKTFYDESGRVRVVEDPLGNQTSFVYDNRNRKWKTFLPPLELADGTIVYPTIKTLYDPLGNVRFVEDAKFRTTETRYDGANRPYLIIDPLLNETQTQYDANGNVRWVEDANGNITVNTYDSHNRLKTTTDAEKISVENEYDLHGNLTAVIDGRFKRTEFEYDGLGRLRKTLYPGGDFEELEYNAVNKVKRTTPNGVTNYPVYDDRHRLKRIDLPNNNVRRFEYGDFGNIESVTDSIFGGKTDVSYSHDNLNRVRSETCNGVTHLFFYDLAGNVTETTIGGTDRIIISTYNAHNKIESITENDRTTSYFYDQNLNLEERRFSNGQKVSCHYDELNRLKTRIATRSSPGGDQVLQSFTYEYDSVGNVRRMEENYGMDDVENRIVRLKYDKAYRLKDEAIFRQSGTIQATSYDYDDSHNRTKKTVLGLNPSSTSYRYNDLNQLTSFTEVYSGLSAAFEYDGNGNRVKRTNASTGEVTEYHYDPDNRLISVAELDKKHTIKIAGPNGLQAKAHFTVDRNYGYTYDYRTRRIDRDENGVKTDIVFLGGTSVMEFEGSGNGAEPDRAAGAVPTVEYIRGSDLGGGIGGILYSLRDGQPSFTWYNNRGDVVAKTADDGSLTYQAAYEAFGTRTQEEGETEDRQRANTREETAWGGLYENMRWRDLETGTYLTRDPAGFVDGPNLYAYVRQNPWTLWDPLGLNPWQRRPPSFFESAFPATSYAVASHHGTPPPSMTGNMSMDIAASKGPQAVLATPTVVSGTAFLGITIGVPAVVIAGPPALGYALTPTGAYTIAETGTTAVEIAAGYEGPPIIPGPGDVVRAGVQATKRTARSAIEGGGFAHSISPQEIVELNKQFSGLNPGRALGSSSAKDTLQRVQSIFTNASYQDGFFKKAASLIQDIAGGHKFQDGNKRTTQAVIETLIERNKVNSAVDSARLAKIINQVADGSLSGIDDIAGQLKAGTKPAKPKRND